MPFNLLLLPLLAGYLFLAKSHIRSYATSQLQKEQLLLAAAWYGLWLLTFSRIAVVGLLSTEAGTALGEFVHTIAPFPYIGTSLGTIVLAALFWNFSNLFVTEQVAGFWLYHRKEFDPLTRLFWESSIGSRPTPTGSGFSLLRRMFVRIVCEFFRHLTSGPARRAYWKSPSKILRLFYAIRDRSITLSGLPSGNPKPVMINLKDSKVIVGLVQDLPANRPAAEFINILPLWTGYRDSDTKRLYKTVDYEEALQRIESADELSRVLRIADIASATIWSETAFTVPEASEG